MRGHIRARGKNSWAVVIDLGRDPLTGKRRRKWYSVKGTRKNAEKLLTKLLAEVDSGDYIDTTRITFGEYLNHWLSNIRPTLAPRTYEGYALIIKKHLIPALGNISLAKLQPIHLQEYYTHALVEGRKDGRGKTLSGQTVLHHHRLIHRALHQAVRWQMIPRNVADAVAPPRATRTEPRTLSPEEIHRLLETAAGHWLQPIIHTAVMTGLRRGELLGIRWRDIDFETKTISVNQTVQRTSDGVIIGEPKTPKSRRRLAIPPSVLETLIKVRQDQDQGKAFYGQAYRDHDLVFAQADGRPIDPQNLTHTFERLVRRAGLHPVRLHDLRHTHATLLLQRGEHPKIVAERLGHSRVGVTLDIYSHAVPGLQEAAATGLDEFVFGQRKIEKGKK